MDQGQDMQFYFVQDDYRLSPKLTANVGVRYEYATPPLETGQPVREFRSGDRHDDFCEGRQHVRARADPSRSQQLRAAPRVRIYALDHGWSSAAATGSSTRTRSGRDAKGCSGSILRTSSTTSCRRASSGAAAVASAAPFRLVDGYPSGLLDPTRYRPTVRRRAQDAESAHAVHPAVQHRRAVRVDAGSRARRGVCRQQGHEAEWLPQSEPARRHHQPGRIAVGRRAALSGLRRHPVDGEPRQLQLQVAADAPGETLLAGPVRARQLHPGARRSRARRITSRRAAAARASTPACSASLRTATTCAPSTVHRSSTSPIASSPAMSGNCPSATAAVSARTGVEPDGLRARRLAADRHSRRCRAASR